MHIRKDMDHNNNIEVMVLDGWCAGHVLMNTLREIIQVLGLIYIVKNKLILLWMLVRVFLVSMQC